MTDTQIAAAAGEHFVAYKIATLGFVPALVRQRVPGVDLLASSTDGARTVGLHVKSSSSAVKEKEGDDAFQLRFPLGQRVISAMNDKTIFCFVDLRGLNPLNGPDVYIVPAIDLKKEYDGVQIRKYAQFHHHRPMAAMERYRNNWQPIVSALQAEEAAPQPARVVPAPVPRRRTPAPSTLQTILLVGDSAASRENLRAALAQRGHNVLLADNASAAVELAMAHAIDACLVDLDTPGLNGLEFSETIRQHGGLLGQRPQTWFISGSYRSDILQPGLLAGDSPVLRKPLDVDEICRQLDYGAHPMARAFQGQVQSVPA